MNYFFNATVWLITSILRKITNEENKITRTKDKLFSFYFQMKCCKNRYRAAARQHDIHCHFCPSQNCITSLNTFHRCLLVLTSFKVIDPLSKFRCSACNATRSERCFLLLGAGWGCVRPRAAPAPFPQRPPLQLPLCPHLATYTSTLLHSGFVEQQNLLKQTENILSSDKTVICDQAMQTVERSKDSE